MQRTTIFQTFKHLNIEMNLTSSVLLIFISGFTHWVGPNLWVRPFEGYRVVPLTHSEKTAFVEVLKSVRGKPYRWGGQSVEAGFDCSGLIVWGFSQIELRGFKYGGLLTSDADAHTLYHQNSHPLANLKALTTGDYIAFDADNNNVVEHIAVFSHVDATGRVWVWDAFSKVGRVAYRPIADFRKKNPRFGTPLKVERKRTESYEQRN